MKGFTRLAKLEVDDKETLAELLNEYLEDNDYSTQFYSREDNNNHEIIINSFDIIDTDADNYLIIYDISLDDDNIILNENEYLVITFNTSSIFHNNMEAISRNHINSIYFMEGIIEYIRYDTIEIIFPELLDYIE